jgi:hypothetical protein
VNESAELTKSEVPGMDGYDVEEVSLRLGVAESFDSIDLFNGHFQGDKISAVISASNPLSWCQDTQGALAPCSGFYLAFGASSLGRPRRLVVRPGDWGPSGSRGKIGKNPLTYKEALRKEKVRKNLWQDVGCLCVPLTPKTPEWQAFISHALWRATQRGHNGET